jgi:NADPH-dependent glutamate synthase beta subunit-like oxidoreductase
MVTHTDDDYPADGKVLFDTGSANNSDTAVDKSGTKVRDGTTFVSVGLGKDRYRPVESYEGIHRYDPDFVWEKAEEKRLVRKVLDTTTKYTSH